MDGIVGNTGSPVSNTLGLGGVARPHDVRECFPAGADLGGGVTVIDWVLMRTKSGRGLGLQPIVRCHCGRISPVHRRYLSLGMWSGRGCPECRKEHIARYRELIPDARERARVLARLNGIITRCTDPTSPAFRNYGGRGITVFADWVRDHSKFIEFFKTLVGWDRPELDLDRIDNARGYEPGNLRLVTRSENCRNKRKVNDLEARIRALETENADLRSRLLRAEKPVCRAH